MTKKRIVFLTDCLADLAGGAEKQIYELAQGLDKSTYEVHVVSLDCWGQAPRETIEKTGSQLHIFRVVRIYGLSGLIQGFRFYKFLKDNQIDILLTYHFSSDMWGTFWGHLAGVKMIISNRRDMGFWRNAWHIKAYQLMNHWVNKIVTVSASIKEMIIKEEGLPPERIEVIYNGVQLPEKHSQDAQELRDELGLKSNDIVIMHVANLKPVKGHKYLLEAFAAVSSLYPNVKLVLIGRDDLNGQIQNIAQMLNILDKVLFLGKRDNVQSLLTLADICVLPSLSEGMSNSILEYMAAVKPVIATNVGGNPELVRNGFNGLLVEKENVQQLKDALSELLRNKDKRQNMGQNGFLRAKTEFSMEAMIEHYGGLFKDKDKIKVLHLVSSGGLFGAEQVMLTLASCSDGVTHVIGALNNKHNPHLEIIAEAKKRDIDNVVFESKGRIDFRTIQDIKNFVLNNNIDIIHTHNYKSNFIGAWAARRSHKKWIATIHGWIGTDAKLRWYENIDRFLLKFADKVIVVSESNYQKLLQRRFSVKYLTVINNGIDLNRFLRNDSNKQLKQDFGIFEKDIVIAIVGRLAPEKGHEVLFNAMAQLIKKYSNVKLLVIGDGPLRNTLGEQIKSLSLDQYIILTGIRNDMPNIYGICDILVNASYTEGLPMTILEAMACKVAVIATSVGGVPQVIQNEKNGLLIEPKDSDALIKALTQLIKDPLKRRHLAQEAYINVATFFSDQIMFNKYKDVYRTLLK